MKYMVITEIFTNGSSEYWYYGTYDRNTANEVAISLGNDYQNMVFHSVIPADEAVEWGVKNLPHR